MLFAEKTILLKDGRTAILRSPKTEEAAEMLVFHQTICSETDFVLRNAEECTETVEQEAAFLDGLNQSATNMMIVCEIDGEIAGNCHLGILKRQKVCHRGNVAIGLLRKYWNLGIGTALFREMIAVARANGVTQLELEFIEGNERGRALYEKMGFRVFAERPDAYCLKDGSMRKECMMMLKL